MFKYIYLIRLVKSFSDIQFKHRLLLNVCNLRWKSKSIFQEWLKAVLIKIETQAYTVVIDIWERAYQNQPTKFTV